MSKTKTPLPKEEALDIARREVETLATGGGPIVAGPWTSEIGYELLYWIPFLRWVRSRVGNRREIVAVTRGGAGCWYGGVADRAVEIFDLVEPATLAGELEGRKRKQLAETPFERSLVDAVVERAGLEGATELHPSVMFNLFRRLRKQERLPAFLEVARHERLEPPALPWLDELLPERFLAVRFYNSYAFPLSAANKRFVAALLERVGQDRAVVMLDPPLQVDDHAAMAPVPGAIQLGDRMKAADNLAVQSAAIARSEGFVGTYGGLAYLAPLLGVASVTFYSDRRRLDLAHLDLATRIFGEGGLGDLVALRPGQVEALASIPLPTGLGDEPVSVSTEVLDG